MKTIIKIIAVSTLILSFTTILNTNNTLALDTVSGATNGVDCTDQTWYCAADWEALGYTWNGSYYVPGTSQVTTVATTTKAPTTTPVTTTTPKKTEVAGTTTKPVENTTPPDTTNTEVIETQAPIVETTPQETTPVSSEVEIIEDDNGVNLPLLGGLLLLVAVAGFFVFSKFGNKDLK